MTKNKPAILLSVAVFLAVAFLLSQVFHHRPPPLPNLSFDGDSRQLRRTQIVSTLDAPMQPGKNAIWCATFQAAWKSLQPQLAQPLIVVGAETACAYLNAAADPAPDLPPNSAYIASGAVAKGIIETIGRDFPIRFPTEKPPTFPAVPSDSYIAYAFLKTQVRFSIPYFDARKPFLFTDSSGQSASLRAFGLREEDAYAYYKLRRQVAVLYGQRGFSLSEFALDLCRDSQPVQVVVACTQRQDTLAATLATVEQKIAASARDTAQGQEDGLGPNDTLLVPNLAWRIVHRFRDLEGKSTVPGAWVDLALQEIQFRLDRGGMELGSESKVVYCPVATHYHLSRPFLLYAKTRTATRPFFVMWVDNAELLVAARQ
ncbi:MAG: hypothetical protein ABSH20_01910 [Tepidisphaeraceae bacterium]